MGGGKLTVVPADGERNVIVVDGDLDDYRYYVTEGTTGPMTLLMLFVLLRAARSACSSSYAAWYGL